MKKSQNLINFEKLVTSREEEFINNLDNETINKIRHSKSDAEVRRLLRSKISKIEHEKCKCKCKEGKRGRTVDENFEQICDRCGGS